MQTVELLDNRRESLRSDAAVGVDQPVIEAWRPAILYGGSALTRRAACRRKPLGDLFQRELGSNQYFNGAAFGYGDLSVYPFVRGSIVFGNPPRAGSPLAAWAARAESRESVRKTIEAAQSFVGGIDMLKQMLKSGAFKRQYRDHRLEWMMRSGGIEIVREGLVSGTIRFSQEIS